MSVMGARREMLTVNALFFFFEMVLEIVLSASTR